MGSHQKSPKKTVHVTLGAHLEPFRELCAKNGSSVQDALRQMVAGMLFEQQIPIKGIPFGAKMERPARLELKLLEQEMLALKDFALRDNIAPSVWMIQRLQDAMACEAGTSLGREELRQMAVALDRLQREIVGMAVNLNQLTRKVNSCLDPHKKIPESRLLVLQEIERNMKQFVRHAQTIVERIENPRQQLPLS